MPDLKKLITLEALQAALPSWLKSLTKPSYNADEISDNSTSNKFVTETDKNTWNAKGTYSKPSGGIPKSDLSSLVQASLDNADSALQSETDPTVPTWAKQPNKPSYTQDEVPDGTTYKRVSSTEKSAWNGKQNALSTTQMHAVNSGATQAKINQIQYNTNNGVKNELNVLVDTVKALSIINTGTWNGNIYTIENVGTATFNSDGSITIVKTSTSSRFLIWLAYNIVPSTIAGKWINGCPSGGSQSTYGINVEQIASPYGSKAIDYGNGALINDSTIELGIYIAVNSSYVTSSEGITFYPMICEKSIADVEPSYQPYAFTNSTITTGILDALNEQKNKFNPANITELRNLAQNGSDYAYVATATDTRTQCNFCLFSYNNNTKIDQLASISVTSRRGVITLFTKTSDFNKIAFGHSGRIKDFMVFHDVSGLVNGQSYVLRCIVTQYNPSLANFAFSDVMICTEADYNVSQKFVPFAKSNYELTQYTDGCSLDTVSKSSGSLNDITQNSFAVYNASVTGKPVDNEGNTSAFTGLCKTDVYNSSEAMQTLTRLSNGHRWARTKTAGTWNPWRQLGASCTGYSITPTAINTWTEVTRITIPANCIVKITASIGWDQDPVSGIKLTNESGTILAINEDRSSTNLGGLTLTHIENTKGMSSGYTRVLYGEISRITGGGRTRVTVITEYVEC